LKEELVFGGGGRGDTLNTTELSESIYAVSSEGFDEL